MWWLAEVKIWRGCHVSCVKVWPLEVNVHVWVWFCTGHDRCALDSHWVIQLLNRFESGFSVDRPKDYDAQHIRQSTATMPKIHVHVSDRQTTTTMLNISDRQWWPRCPTYQTDNQRPWCPTYQTDSQRPRCPTYQTNRQWPRCPTYQTDRHTVKTRCPHWTPSAHWTGSNPVWARPHWMHIRPIQFRSGWRWRLPVG